MTEKEKLRDSVLEWITDYGTMDYRPEDVDEMANRLLRLSASDLEMIESAFAQTFREGVAYKSGDP